MAYSLMGVLPHSRWAWLQEAAGHIAYSPTVERKEHTHAVHTRAVHTHAVLAFGPLCGPCLKWCNPHLRQLPLFSYPNLEKPLTG